MPKIFKLNMFKKLFISFILLLIVLILTFGFIFNQYFIKIVENKTLEINQYKVDNIQTAIEKEIFIPVRNLALNYFLQSINEFNGAQPQSNDIGFFLKNPLDADLWRAKTVSEDLAKTINANAYIQTMSVYFVNHPSVISSLTINRSMDGYYDQAFIARLLEIDHVDNTWFAGRNIAFSGFKEKSVISYVRTYPFFTTRGNTKSLLFIDVPESRFTKIIEPFYNKDTDVFMILNRNGDVMTSYGDSRYDPDEIVGKLHGAERNAVELGNEKFIFLQKKSPNEDWVYIILSKQSMIYSELQNLKILMFILCVFILMIGGILSFLLSRKLYFPIKQLLIKSTAAGVGGKQRSIDEFQTLNHFIDDSNMKITSLNFELTEARIADLIFGRKDYDESDTYLMNTNHYTVILFEAVNCDDYGEFYKYTAEFSGANEGNLLITVKKDILAVVFGYDSGYPEFADRLKPRFAPYIRHSKWDTVIAVGPLVAEQARIHFSFEQARYALKYKRLKGLNTVIEYQDIQPEKNIKLSTNLDFMNPLIKLGDQQAVDDYFRSFKENIMRHRYRIEDIDLAMLQHASLIGSCLDELHLHKDVIPYESILDEMNKCKNVHDAIDFLHLLVHKIILVLNGRQETKNFDILSRVKAYIEDNYEKELSLDMLSDKFYLSPTYISRLFKEYFNVGVSEFILDLRLSQAVNLLKSNNHNVNSIASTVGFNSSAYFITKFKKKFGVTPNQYRFEKVMKYENSES